MKNNGVTGPPGIPKNVLDKFGMTSAGTVEAIYIPFGCMYGIFTNIKKTLNNNQMQELYIYTIHGSYGYRNASNWGVLLPVDLWSSTYPMFWGLLFMYINHVYSLGKLLWFLKLNYVRACWWEIPLVKPRFGVTPIWRFGQYSLPRSCALHIPKDPGIS